MKRSTGDAAAFWGIFRETEHSPNREADDAAILRAVGRRLEQAGGARTVELHSGIVERDAGPPALAFSMCEGRSSLDWLARLERSGVCVVNSARSVENTHRERAIGLHESAGVPIPESRVLDTADRAFREDDPLYTACWVKQATEHKTSEGDVIFASDAASLREALEHLRSRKQPRAVVQRHVEGDWIKFYGVGGAPASGDASRIAGEASKPSWFRWLHPREHPVKGTPFDPEALRDVASRAAGVLGLEIWGGDAVVTPDGAIFVVDVNAWPSFALYREEAADHIAEHLAARLRRLVRVAV